MFLIRRPVIDNLLQQVQSSHPSMMQGLHEYHTRPIMALRRGVNPLLVQYDSNEQKEAPTEPISWFMQQAPWTIEA